MNITTIKRIERMRQRSIWAVKRQSVTVILVREEYLDICPLLRTHFAKSQPGYIGPHLGVHNMGVWLSKNVASALIDTKTVSRMSFNLF